MFDKAVTLYGDLRCWSLHGLKLMALRTDLPTTGEECALDKGLWPTDAPGEEEPADDAATKSAWRSCRACWFPCCRDCIEPPCGESCCRNWRISWSSWMCCSWVDCGEGRSSWLCACQQNQNHFCLCFFFLCTLNSTKFYSNKSYGWVVSISIYHTSG